MKKIFISLFVLIILGLFFANTIFAQTNNFGSLSGGVIVATVSINNTKIVSQNDRDFVISFNISNKTGAQSKVKYSVQLTKVSSSTQTIFDEKVYDDALFLGENMIIHKTVNYIVSPSVSAGAYTLYIRSQNASGLPLSIVRLGDVKISANILGAIEIIPNTCTFSYSQNKYFGTSTNNKISTESINAKCKVKSTFLKDTPMVLNFVTRSPSVFGSIVPIFGTSTRNMIIKKGTNDVTITMPEAKKPQNYNLSFYLASADAKILSNTISYDYAVAGEQGTIKNVVFDKTYYKAGDTANLQIYSSQSSTSTISAIIRDNSGIYCSATSSKIVSGVAITNLLLSITKNCLNPKASVILSDMNGKILDSNNLQLITTTGSTSLVKAQKSSRTILFVVIIVLVLILGILIYRKKYFVLKLILLFFIAASFWFGVTKNVVATSGCDIVHCLPPSTFDYTGTCSMSYYCAGDVRMRTIGGSCSVTYYNNPDHVTGISPDETLMSTCPFGCSDGQCRGRAHITNFSYDSGSVISGDSTNLRWTVQNASSCYINRNDSLFTDGLGSSGFVSTGPLTEAPNAYQLICNSYRASPLGTTYSEVISVNVITNPQSPPQNNTIVSTSTPNPVSYGGDTVFSADISNFTNPDFCTITSSQGGTFLYDFSVYNSSNVPIPKTISVYSNNVTSDTTFQATCDGGGYTVNGVHQNSSMPLTVHVLPESFKVTLSSASSTVNKGDLVKVNWNANESDSVCQITADDPNIQSYSNLSASNISSGVNVGPITSTTTVSIACQNNNMTSTSAEGAIQTINPILAPFSSLMIIGRGDSSGYAGFFATFDTRSIPYDYLVSGYQQGQVVTVLNPVLPYAPFTNHIDDISALYTKQQVGCWDASCASINIDSVDHTYGGIMSLHLNDGGEGYSVGDEPWLMPMSGGQNTLPIKVTETDGVAGAIKNISILYGGSGYKVGDQLTIQSGNYDAKINVDSVDENGSATGISLIENGSGYFSAHIIGEIPWDVSGGNGTGLQVGIDDIYGKILSLSYDSNSVYNGSSGYSVGDIVPLSGGSGPYGGMSGATIQVDQVGQGIPTKISLSQAGAGYETGWAYPIDGPGYPLVTITKAQPIMNFFTSSVPSNVATDSVMIKVISNNPPLPTKPIIHRKTINIIEWEADGAKSCSLIMNIGTVNPTVLPILNATSSSYQVLGGIKDTDTFTIACDTGTTTISGKIVNPNATCVSTQTDQDLYINKNIQWSISPDNKNIELHYPNNAIWNGDEIPINASTYPLNIIYKTVGQKYINGSISATDDRGARINLECETTTTVKLDSGTIKEI